MTSASTSGDMFTYVGVPTVTAVSPTSGSTGRRHVGDHHRDQLRRRHRRQVRRHGRHQLHGQLGHLDHRHVAGRAAGTVDVVVTTTDGTSATSAADQFTYVAAPTVTAVSPTKRPGAGGTR